jgi:glutamate/tyrosine decarboxylase-like PLP-dependent enzyme
VTLDSSLEALRQALAKPLPHPDEVRRAEEAGLALRWLLEHFATLPTQAIGLTAGRAEMDALLAEPPPETGRDFAAVLDAFRAHVAAYAFRVNHPRFFAFVPSAPSFYSMLGDLLCVGANFFAGVWLEAAGPAAVELVVLDWFRTFLGMPESTRGVLTNGGSEANLIALAVARDRLSRDDRNRAVLYCAVERHHSVDRAARILGFYPEQIRTVASDERFRLDSAALAAAVAADRASGRLPWAVVATAGTTNTGAVDPLARLADLCANEWLWLHVDAAYGWAAVLDGDEQKQLAGIDRADSVTLDPHKWFAQCFEAGCVLVRDGRQLFDSFCTYADYLRDVTAGEDEINFADHGIALTRRFRALKIWMSVKVLGVAWFRELVGRCCRLAEFAQGLLEHAAVFEILCPRQLSIVCFRYRPAGFGVRGQADEQALDELNQAILEQVRASGRAFLSSTTLNGRLALRFCFVNWRTTAADVEEVIALLRGFGENPSGTTETRRHREEKTEKT